MNENFRTPEEELKEIYLLLKEIEKKMLENRVKYNDSNKTIKDLRRIFDQDSSRMNQTIFNDAPTEEIYQETLRTIAILMEILLRTKKG